MGRVLSWLTIMVCVSLAAAPAQAGFSGTDVFLPSVGLAQGVANWYTTVWVHNPGDTAAYAEFFFLERDRDNTGAARSTGRVDPGETLLVRNMFGHEGFGAIRVTSSAALLVTSRIYSKAPSETERASKGQDFAGIPASFAIGAGQKTRLLGVHQTVPADNSELRYNFGFVETTGAGCTVRVTPLDGDGIALVAGKSYDVLPLGQHQYQFKNEFPTVFASNTVLEIEVTSGAGRVIAFGSGITNGSQDPTTFEMAFDDALLGCEAGTIKGVTAGPGLSVGGMSGTVTLQIANTFATAPMAASEQVVKNLNGTLSKTAGSLKIDHPLGPEHESLLHSFVALPDMENVYDGVAVLDEWGEAVVELPAYFEALDRGFRYQLTCIGGFAPVYIAEKIIGNRFRIAGGAPGMEVSWQVTGTGGIEVRRHLPRRGSR